MNQYKLKPNQPDFEMVDGPMTGRKFKAGEVYIEIPETEKGRFEEIKEESSEFGVQSSEKKQPAARTLQSVAKPEVNDHA